MSIKTILTELKQRLLKFEALHGAYMVPLGGLVIFLAIAYAHFVIQATCFLVGLYCVIEGIHKIGYNPIKKEAVKILRRGEYLIEHELGIDTTVVKTPSASPAAVTPPVTKGT